MQIYNCTAYVDRDRILATLPAGYRPTSAIEGSTNIGAIGQAFAGQSMCFVRVLTSGEVIIAKGGIDGDPATGQVSFPCVSLP